MALREIRNPNVANDIPRDIGSSLFDTDGDVMTTGILAEI